MTATMTVKTTHSKIDSKTYRFETALTIGETSVRSEQLVDKRQLKSMRITAAGKTMQEKRELFAEFLNSNVESKVARAYTNIVLQAQAKEKALLELFAEFLNSNVESKVARAYTNIVLQAQAKEKAL